MSRIFLLHSHHKSKSLMDKHLRTLLTMDHPNISRFIKLHCHKLTHMFDLLDYRSIHLNKYMHMYEGKGLHKLIDF